jgi:AraC-like DNA-binding protein
VTGPLREWLTLGIWLVEGTCPVDFEHWTDDTPQVKYRISFARAGAYLRRMNGVESIADSTTVMVSRPGDEVAVAHPFGCGDEFTILEADSGTEPEWDAVSGEYRVTDELSLHHRRLVSLARRGIDKLELGERLAVLIDRVPARYPRERRWSPQTVRAHRKLALGATEALIGSGYEAGLEDIASHLSCSPHHLSRVFSDVMGLTLTEYRNRLRVSEVLKDLQDGAENLRELAIRYGFADQAHMIRVVRRHHGAAPGTLQKLLKAPIAHGSTTPR